MFNYGVSIDPNYPLFYYNIACLYGGKDDVENAISYLQKAFANKAHVIPGEKNARSSHGRFFCPPDEKSPFHKSSHINSCNLGSSKSQLPIIPFLRSYR
jgi:hypothetical protein